MHGLIKDNLGADVPLPIKEGDCRFLPLEVDDSDSSAQARKRLESYVNRAKRLRTNSACTSPADRVEVHLRIVSALDESHLDTSRHVLYRVAVETVILNSSQRISQPDSSPMIMKVAAELEGRTVAKEAVMYEHLHCLQGTVIPQCYGYFRRFIDLQNYVVTAWDPDCTFPRKEESFDIFRMPNSRASLNVLLLEDVGACITPACLSKEEKGNVLFVSRLCCVTARPHESIGAHSGVCMTSSATSVFVTKICGTGTCFKPRFAAVCRPSTRRSTNIAS